MKSNKNPVVRNQVNKKRVVDPKTLKDSNKKSKEKTNLYNLI